MQWLLKRSVRSRYFCSEGPGRNSRDWTSRKAFRKLIVSNVRHYQAQSQIFLGFGVVHGAAEVGLSEGILSLRKAAKTEMRVWEADPGRGGEERARL